MFIHGWYHVYSKQVDYIGNVCNTHDYVIYCFVNCAKLFVQ